MHVCNVHLINYLIYCCIMLIDYNIDQWIGIHFAKQPESTLKKPEIFVSNKLDFDEIVEEVMLRLYRCDIVHVWFSGCNIHVDTKVPELDDKKHPHGFHGSLTIDPSYIPGSGRTHYIKYLIQTRIFNDFDNRVTDFADDLLFDLYRYGECDMKDIERGWENNFGRYYYKKIRVIKASEMPKKNKIKWAKSLLIDMLMPSEKLSKKMKSNTRVYNQVITNIEDLPK